MKKNLTLTFALLSCIAVFAQSPQAVCYQAVATDAAGIELQARNISVLATIHQTTITGTVVAQETYSVTTDDFGLFNLEIGQGVAVDGTPAFTDIDWASGPFFLKMEMDPAGGTDYISMGTSQILSVPYAIYSEKAGTAQNAVNAQTAATALDDNDTSPDNEIQDLQYDTATGILTLSNSDQPGVNISSFDSDADPANELQNLQVDPTTGGLTLSNSTGTPVIVDIDNTNELQDLTYDAATGALGLTNSTGATVTVDGSATNELQGLTYNATTGQLNLTNSTEAPVDIDASTTNELQDLQYEPATGILSLSNAPGAAVTIDVEDADANPSNELQDLDYNETTGALALTNAPGAGIIINTDDEDASPTNEIQTLSIEGNVLSISGTGGNSIDFGEELFGAPGASSDFPQGIVGEHLVLKTGTFTVPAGKSFYLTAGGNAVTFLTPNNVTVSHPTTPNMPVFGPNTVITDCRCTGMLVDFNANIAPAVLDLTVAADTYTVPAGFILFVKSGISNAMTGALKIDGDDMEFLRPNFTRGSRIISFPEGTNIQRPINSDPGAFVLTGYLIATPN